MFAIEVVRNGNLLARAGIAGASSILVNMRSFVDGDTPGSIHVIGLTYLSEERSAHVVWVDETPLHSGDRISLLLVESSAPSQPSLVQPHDSVAYAAQMEQLADNDENDPVLGLQGALRWPGVSYMCSVNEINFTNAVCGPSDVGMLCTVIWNRQTPNLMEAYVRSLNETSKPTDWLRADLTPGDELAVVLSA